MRWGLIRPDSHITSKEIFKLYETWDKRKPIYELEYLNRTDPEAITEGERAFLTQSRRIPIKMIGIWDSVATVGVPIGNFSRFSRNALQFHNPRWSSTYEHFYHALAIDEHRKPFRSVILHHYINNGASEAETQERREKFQSRVEQRWFCGSHGDVGGGDNLPVVSAPFAWIMAKAASHGLALEHIPQATQLEHTHALGDSYKAFLKGLYRLVRFGKRYRREIGSPGRGVSGGWIEPIREVIDVSVFKRWQADTKYRPKNLIKALETRPCDPDSQDQDFRL